MNNIGLHIVGTWFEVNRLCGPNWERPQVVKLVDPSVEFVRMVKSQVGPDCLIVIRFWEPEQPLGAPDTDARWWYSKRVGEMLAMTGPNVAFESYNEVPDGLAREYARFEATRLGLMHAAGMRSVVLNSSVGTPDYHIWQYYRPMLDAMKAGDMVGLHEYWPDMDGISKRWWCGRWNNVPELLGRPIVVTECGRDEIKETRPDGSTVIHGKPGWMQTCNVEEYLDDLRQYAQVLNGRPACVFTGGRIDPKWTAFNVNDIWDRVTAEYADNPPITPPTPPAQPAPDNRPFSERFPEAFAEWAEAGGIEHHFRVHCLALLKHLTVTDKDVDIAIGNATASIGHVGEFMERRRKSLQ